MKTAKIERLPPEVGADTIQLKKSSREGKTQASEVFERLRADIVHCQLQPGQRLRFEELRANYGVGLSPLREALMRLSSDGLVTLEDQRGFRVAPVSRADLIDLTMMREELETKALSLSLEKGGDEWEANLISSFHMLLKLTKLTGPNKELVDPEWEVRHQNFHDALVAACGSPILLHFRSLLSAQAARYRQLAVHYLKHPRGDIEEHKHLLDAALARDSVRLCAAMRMHFRHTTEIVLSGMVEDDVRTA